MPAGKSLANCAFRYRETTDFDCFYQVKRTGSRAGVAPAEVQRLFTAHCYANYQERWANISLCPASEIKSQRDRPVSFVQ
jgi:hypothetical protein